MSAIALLITFVWIILSVGTTSFCITRMNYNLLPIAYFSSIAMGVIAVFLVNFYILIGEDEFSPLIITVFGSIIVVIASVTGIVVAWRLGADDDETDEE